MLTAEAQVETTRSSRYLVQLCSHAAKIGGTHGHRPRAHGGGDADAFRDVQVTAEWSETHGTVTFTPRGRCTIQATPDALTLHVEAADEQDVRRIQEVITRDLDRSGRRDHLTVNWQRPETPNVQPSNGPEATSE